MKTVVRKLRRKIRIINAARSAPIAISSSRLSIDSRTKTD